MPPDPASPTAKGRHFRRKLAWVLLVLSLVLVMVSAGWLAQSYRSRPEPDPGVPRLTGSGPVERQAGPPLDDCHTPATDALGLGRKTFDSEPDAIAALGDMLLLPDPDTLPDGARFTRGSYMSNMKSRFQLFIIGLLYEAESTAVEILVFNLERYEGPVEAHIPISIRGRDGYLFQPPFGEGYHSVMWREGCPWVSVTARLPADAVLEIAAALHRPGAPAEELTTRMQD